MIKIKEFIKKYKMIIMIISIILICSIAIAFGVYAQITNRSEIKQGNEDKYIALKGKFKESFTNTVNIETNPKENINYEEIIYCKHDVVDKKEGKYDVIAKIPAFKGESETIKEINKQINKTFTKEIAAFAKEDVYGVTYSLDYVAYVNNNIISLVIRGKYKEGSKPQKIIVQTYNYDIEKDKLLNIEDIIKYKNLDKKDMQDRIQEEIKKENIQNKSTAEQGFNIFIRDESSKIYQVENTPNFFLGEDNYLYLVYAYGNEEQTYTSQIDLVIF